MTTKLVDKEHERKVEILREMRTLAAKATDLPTFMAQCTPSEDGQSTVVQVLASHLDRDSEQAVFCTIVKNSDFPDPIKGFLLFLADEYLGDETETPTSGNMDDLIGRILANAIKSKKSELGHVINLTTKKGD